MLKKMARAESMEHFAILEKVKCCFATEAAEVRIIETKDYEIIKAWIKAEMEDEKRVVKLNPACETGIYTAVSKPKTE